MILIKLTTQRIDVETMARRSHSDQTPKTSTLFLVFRNAEDFLSTFGLKVKNFKFETNVHLAVTALTGNVRARCI